MATWAQVRNNRIRLIVDGEKPPYPGTWVDITGKDYKAGFELQSDGTFVQAPEPFNHMARAREIVQSIDTKILLETETGKALAAIIILLLKEDIK